MLSAADGERTFSKLKIIKCYLRSSVAYTHWDRRQTWGAKFKIALRRTNSWRLSWQSTRKTWKLTTEGGVETNEPRFDKTEILLTNDSDRKRFNVIDSACTPKFSWIKRLKSHITFSVGNVIIHNETRVLEEWRYTSFGTHVYFKLKPLCWKRRMYKIQATKSKY